MITKGMYAAGKGMLALIEQSDVIANNLANVNTTGFKKTNLAFKSIFDAQITEKTDPNDIKFSETRDLGTYSMGPVTHRSLLDFSQGNIERTDNPLDLALQGDGFFKLKDLDGNITYTRNGSFVLNNEKMLTTKEGEYVLDSLDKPIKLDVSELNITNPHDLAINEDGQICINAIDNQTALQKIKIVDFRIKSDLIPLGNSKYKAMHLQENPEMPAEKFKLQQRALECANSNTVSEMINMINVSRSYETLSKFVKNDSDLVTRAINLGRIS